MNLQARKETRFEVHVPHLGEKCVTTGLTEAQTVALLKKLAREGAYAVTWQIGEEDGRLRLKRAGGTFYGADRRWHWDFTIRFTTKKWRECGSKVTGSAQARRPKP